MENDKKEQYKTLLNELGRTFSVGVAWGVARSLLPELKLEQERRRSQKVFLKDEEP